MEPFIPKEKLSKKTRRALARRQRNTWGPLNPVTRRVENKKTYNRKRVRQREDDVYHAGPFYTYTIPPLKCG